MSSASANPKATGRKLKLPAPKTLPALHANAGLEAAYRRQLQELIRVMAQSMLLHIRAAYRVNPPTVGFAVDDDPVLSLGRSIRKWGDRWIKRLERAATRIAAAFATKSQRHLDTMFEISLKRAGFTVKFQASKTMQQAYRAVVAENVNLIKSIPAQFLKDVESSVWASVMKGADLDELAAGIESAYGVAHRRAALIARDQNAKAKAIMEETRRGELGITEAVWQHSSAGKHPRPTHVAMNGQKYDTKRGMWDPAVQEYVWPGTLINCRCTSRAILPF